MSRAVACALLVLALSCGGETPTEIVLVVDSDLDVPAALDEIEITAAGRSGAPVTLVADLTVASTPDLPITLTLYPAVEPPPPLAVVVIGKLADAEVLRRDVTTEFVVGETRMLRVLLAARCLDTVCEGTTTCDETGCRPIEVAASDLPEWPGQAPVLDGPACTPREEACNLADDDCDGTTDEGIDVGIDPLHCGECGRACPAGATCTAGLCAGEQAVAIAAGGAHTCAVRADGTLTCWGWNLHGQLGDGTTADRLEPVDVPGLTGVSAVTAGVAHTCARAGEAVYCFGDNAFGEVGDGSAQPHLTPTRVELSGVVDVRAGVTHTCAVTTGGMVHCWGDNTVGQLGTGTGLPSLSPAPVTLPSAAAGIAVGFHHACAALTTGAVSCWGGNGNGQLGDASTTQRPTPVSVMGLVDAVEVTAGHFHTCARRMDGTVSCWGDGSRGQLGDGSTVMRPVPGPVTFTGTVGALVTGAAADHTCVLSGSGVSCWGSNAAGQLSNPVAGTSPVPVDAVGFTTPAAVASGGSGTVARGHTCVLDDVGAVFCVGDNGLGQLGNGTRTGASAPVAVRLRR